RRPARRPANPGRRPPSRRIRPLSRIHRRRPWWRVKHRRSARPREGLASQRHRSSAAPWAVARCGWPAIVGTVCSPAGGGRARISRMTTIPNARTWQPGGWQDGIKLSLDLHGRIKDTVHGGTIRQRVVPGIANLHSHAFQRAMAGMAERQSRDEDSFWSWREAMYHFAQRLDPDAMRAVAAQLYAEMLEAGYTTVCEFHYLHHGPDGTPYDDPAAMS